MAAVAGEFWPSVLISITHLGFSRSGNPSVIILEPMEKLLGLNLGLL